jgi:hypothetical protein
MEEKKPDKKTAGKPESLKRVNADFFQELPITINIEDGDSFVVFMRPLKIKEIQILNRVAHLQEKNPGDEQAAMMLVSLVINTLNVSGDEIPVGAASGLVSRMIEYNFPRDQKTEDKKSKKNIKGDLIDCFDFLIAQGHRHSDIMEYTISQFNNFIVIIAERLGIKKKPMDAAEAFRKLGLPVKQRNKAETK